MPHPNLTCLVFFTPQCHTHIYSWLSSLLTLHMAGWCHSALVFNTSPLHLWIATPSKNLSRETVLKAVLHTCFEVWCCPIVVVLLVFEDEWHSFLFLKILHVFSDSGVQIASCLLSCPRGIVGSQPHTQHLIVRTCSLKLYQPCKSSSPSSRICHWPLG